MAKELIQRFLNSGSSEIAFSLYDGEQMTDISFSQFVDDILKAAGYFKERGISGQHIALVAPNCYRWITTFFGILASGNVAVMVNPSLPADTIKQQMIQAEVSAVCADTAEVIQTLKEVQVECVPFADVADGPALNPEEIHQARAEDTIIMMGTSGTTGKSKIVEISLENLESSMAGYPSGDVLIGIDRALLVLPLYHISGIAAATICLLRGKTVCIGRGIRAIFADMPILKPTFITVVPMMMESLMKIYKATTPEDRVKRLGGRLQRICVAGAAPKVAVCQYLMEQGLILETGYGMTESMGVGTCGEWNIETIGSVGKLCGNMQCKIEDGEILFKGKSVMKGYYKDPEETAKIIVDGWLHTGDMGYCDSNGYYYITGRKKNVIILSNGENVNPEEIEAKFSECEEIEECLVYSDGKGICADVYAKNTDVAAVFIKEYNQQMPFYRQVYKVNFKTEPLEKTGSGKIKRKVNE